MSIADRSSPARRPRPGEQGGAPHVVAIGGGHGLAVTLRAAATYADDLTGIVSVADDGGSSGRLRELTGLPAMGDIRRCLSSMADPDSRLGELLEHRFDGGLDGHALGNLLIVALAERLGFTEAIGELTRLVGSPVRILPVTETAVVLAAETDHGRVHGQVAVQRCGRITTVALEPTGARPAPGVVEAIAAADQVVLGPGSLYTSVLAAAVLPPVRDAIAASSAQRVYVCNLRPQMAETDGYDVAAHVDALRHHGIDPDVVVFDPGSIPAGRTNAQLVGRAVAHAGGLVHDPARLGDALRALLGTSERPG